MSTFAKSFKAEVTRLARKEAKAAIAPIRKPSGATRSAIADLKRRVAFLEKETRRLSALVAKLSQPTTYSLQSSPTSASRTRITGKGMRALRRKLRLSADLFGKLLGVSGQAVYQWESRNGPLRVRQPIRGAILSIRNLGAREAKARLQSFAKR